MNEPSRSNTLWQEHVERLQRLYGRTPARSTQVGTERNLSSVERAEEARRAEWTATPPGRLGRRLLVDIETYLGFFAIARAD
jgi:hypothetical protein